MHIPGQRPTSPLPEMPGPWLYLTAWLEKTAVSHVNKAILKFANQYGKIKHFSHCSCNFNFPTQIRPKC